MARGHIRAVVQHLRRLAGSPEGGDQSDRMLLSRYLAGDGEDAFGLLVERHGPLVWGTCRRVLRNEYDAEDAFQAAFLVLARKAASIVKHASLSGWLYRVAFRIACKAKADVRKGQKSELVDVPEPLSNEGAMRELKETLDAEINRLPEKYRKPIILCYLQGKSNEEAASLLSCSLSAMKVRLLRARERLHKKLTKRGIALSASAFATALAQPALASTAPPTPLVITIIKAASELAAGKAVSACGTTAAAAALAEGVIKDMFFTKLKLSAVLFVCVCLMSTGAGLLLGKIDGGGPKTPVVADEDKPPKREYQPLPKFVAATKGDAAAVVKGNNQFAFDLYGKLREKEGNLFFSPYSISTALGMTYAGARGETAKEMENVLRFPLPQEKLHSAFADIIKEVNGDGRNRGYELSVANSLWAQKDLELRTDFVKLTKDHYRAGMYQVDYVQDAEGARKTINAWVEKETNDKIQELLKPRMVSELTRLVLVNAIYFKSLWKHEFNEKLTKQEPFFLAPDKKTDVALMHQECTTNYYRGDQFQLLELPYQNYALSMLILLPNKVDGVAALERDLTNEKLAGWLEKMKTYKVTLTLPKFKVTSEFILNQQLEKMGMTSAFKAGSADFSGMTSKERFVISRVIHKAYVDVNEKGTEAAAATAVVVDGGGGPSPEGKVEFRADHPFIFLIRDNKTGSILFQGRVTDPTAKK